MGRQDASCLDKKNISLHMLAKYVDDINMVIEVNPKGSLWTKEAKREWVLT